MAVAGRPRRKGIVRKLRRSKLAAAVEPPLLGALIWLVLRFLRLTTRLELVGIDALRERWAHERPSALAFWHGRSIMLPFLYGGPGISIMNSTHRDGEIITRALARFGIASTRGSSTRTAISGSLGLLRALRGGRDIAIIPDGPRGPAGVAKAGATLLASAGDVPLFPVAFSATRSVRLRSWDRMMLPLPGARVVCVIGEPLEPIRGKIDARARETLRQELENRLNNVTRRADDLVGRLVEAT